MESSRNLLVSDVGPPTRGLQLLRVFLPVFQRQLYAHLQLGLIVLCNSHQLIVGCMTTLQCGAPVYHS